MPLEKSVLRILSLCFLFLTLSVARANAQVTVSCTLPAAQVEVPYAGAGCSATGGTAPYTFTISAGALPTGLSLSETAGPSAPITGTPTTAGTAFSFTVFATDSSSPTQLTGSASFSMNVELGITCTLPATAQVGVSYTGASCIAAGGISPYTYSVSAGLPDGLTLSSSTGAITGMPTTAGPFSFIVSATDSTSPTQLTGSANFSMNVAVGITCTFPAAQVGVSYSGASCSASGGTGPYTFTFSASAPSWFVVAGSPGTSITITGMPTAAGTFSFTATATDSSSPTQLTGTFSVTNFVVSPAAPPPLVLTCMAPLTAQVGVAYSGSCGATGGTPPYTFAATGSYPSWLSVNGATGAITGTPTATGTYSFTLQVTDSAGVVATQAVTNLVVSPATLTLSCTAPLTAQVGVAYTGSCSATGGTGSNVFAATGSYPSWLSVNGTSGAITGTPTAAGTYSFTLQVTDSAGVVATQAVTNLVVSPATLTLSCTAPLTAQVGVAYTGGCSATGGTGSNVFAASGSYPSWLSVNGTSGAITGTPTATGTYSFTLQVTDSAGVVATQAVTNLVVSPAGLVLTCTAPLTAQVGVAYTGSCSATGGTGSNVFAASGSYPSWLSVNGTSGAITGTPTATGTYSFTLQVTDSAGVVATQAVTNLVVSPAGLVLTCTAPLTAQVGVAYKGSCSATGGTGSNVFAATGGYPSWLSVNGTTGAITGTPTATGTYSFTLQVTDSAGVVATQAVTNLVVSPAGLVLTCTAPLTAQVGVAYTGSCSATGGTGSNVFAATGSYPSWLSVNGTSGAITGTPTAAGTYSFTLQVTDSAGVVATQAVTNLVVSPAALTLSCTAPLTAEVGVAYTGSCSATGGTGSNVFAATGSYPSWLSVNGTSGAITGTPTAAGTYSFTLQVTDSAGVVATQAVTNLVVSPATLTLSCRASTQGIVGIPYSANCKGAAGTTPYTFSVSSGSLPNGLTLNSSSGAISGTPTTASTFTFTIKVTDSGNPAQTATQPLTVTIIPLLTVTTTSLSNGIVGISYSASCSATGGTPPYTFSISAGSLPTGLSLSSSCGITGTPTAGGTFNFSIKVTDSGTPAQTATQPLSITVNPALAITSTTAPNGSVGLAYTLQLTAQNGTPPYNWSISGGTLPPGLNLSGGLISGTPTTVGTYSFTVKVTDSGSPMQTQTQTFSNVSIAAGLTITTTSVPNSFVGNPGYTATLTAQNGVPPYTWSISGGALPGGLTLSAGGAITGTPNAPGSFSFTVKVTDSTTPTPQVATQALSIAIAPVLTLSSSGFPSGVVGVGYSTSCSAGGGTSPYSFSISAGSLPAGLSLNTSNCLINGTPTGSGGTSNFTIQVSDSGNPAQSKTQAFSITIGLGLTITTSSPLPSAFTGQGYSTTLTAANGQTPYTWAWSGTTPGGLSLNSSTGTISGVPTTAGTYSFAVTVTDSTTPTRQVATQTFGLSVTAGLTITTTTLGAATQSSAYSATLTAANGTPPLTWTLASGSLPVGLTLSSAGTISGTPTTPGTFSFTVKVTDSSGPPQSATQTLSLVVNPTPLTITSTTLGSATLSSPYSATLTAVNGTAPLTWTLTTGSLPPGLSLSSAGAISGTPTTPGNYSFSVTVTDSSTPQKTATQPLILVVNSSTLTITATSLLPAMQNIPYSATLTAVNGTTPLAWTWAPGTDSSLPAGLTLNAATGVISGTPTTVGTFQFIVSVTDSSTPAKTASQPLTLLVNPASGVSVPSFTFNLPTKATPGQSIPASSIDVTYSAGIWDVGVTLGFAAAANGVPATYMDPALQFVDSSGKALGTTFSTQVASATSISLPQIAPGTVEGSISVTLTLATQTGSPYSPTPWSISVPASVPIISSVQITNVTSTGFDVEIIANSSPRDLETAAFTFTPASGLTINGTTFSVDVSSQMTAWYTSTSLCPTSPTALPCNQQYGSEFSLTVPFTFSGSASAIASVSVTLTNSAGMSAAVSGTN